MTGSTPFYRRHKVAFFMIGTCFLFFVFAFAKKEDSNLQSFRSQFQKNNQPAARDTVPGENKKGGAVDNQLMLDRQLQVNYHLLQQKAILENHSQIKSMERSLSKTEEELTRQAETIQMDVEHTIAENLYKVKKSLETAQMELGQLKSFTNDLENDGLIKKGGKYTIDIKKGDLYINGVKQPDRVVKKYREKYRQYFEGGKDGFMLRSNYPAWKAEVI